MAPPTENFFWAHQIERPWPCGCLFYDVDSYLQPLGGACQMSWAHTTSASARPPKGILCLCSGTEQSSRTGSVPNFAQRMLWGILVLVYIIRSTKNWFPVGRATYQENCLGPSDRAIPTLGCLFYTFYSYDLPFWKKKNWFPVGGASYREFFLGSSDDRAAPTWGSVL